MPKSVLKATLNLDTTALSWNLERSPETYDPKVTAVEGAGRIYFEVQKASYGRLTTLLGLEPYSTIVACGSISRPLNSPPPPEPHPIRYRTRITYST